MVLWVQETISPITREGKALKEKRFNKEELSNSTKGLKKIYAITNLVLQQPMN